MKKQFCTIFLLLVLAIQILPIRQMGSLLSSNQLTEELPHSANPDKSCLQKIDLKSDYLSASLETPVSAYISFSHHHPGFADAIPQNYTGDIHVPPPNC
ncbi:MAG: hypothetical protein HYU70_01630 [Bacteroidetes bacterium]|jgi:hypothetical protein|nr:hypothetical protein [Bacteroidota bacterium]